LRRILVVGAHAVLKLARQKPEKYPWLTQLLARKPFKVVAVALANKMARIAWALLVRGGRYRARALVAAAYEGRSDRARQQDRQDGVGDDGQG
jgi:transposase